MTRKPKTRKNQPTKQITNKPAEDTHSLLFWALLSITAVFLFWSPFQKGLFNSQAALDNIGFDKPLYTAFVWSAIILFLLSIYLFYNYKYRTMKDFFVLAIWLLPLSYLISMVGAASHYYATNMVYLHIMYAGFFITANYLTRNRIGNLTIQYSILISGYLIVLFGLLNWFGNLGFANGIAELFTDLRGAPAYTHAVMTDSNGARLTSVFQYANSYAAFLIAIALGCLFFVIKSRKWYSTLLHGMMLVPILLSFFLTLSRGGLVVFPIVVLVLLFFFTVHRQIMFILYLGLTSIGVLLVLGNLTDSGLEIQKQLELHGQLSQSLSLKSWGILILTSVLLAALIFLLHEYVMPGIKKWLDVKINNRYSTLLLPVSAVLIGSLAIVLLFTDTGILPKNIQTRVDNINLAQHSVLERGTFYGDSIKLVKDYPLFGAGGGAWAALYQKYQNNPYLSRQAHNFFLQYLVEVGIVGFLVLMSLLAFIIFYFVRTYFANSSERKDEHLFYFIIALSILMHSAIDFNLSYAFLAVLIYISLGGLVSGFGSIKAPFLNWTSTRDKWFPIVKSGAIGLIAIIFLVISIRLAAGSNHYIQAITKAQQGEPYPNVLASVDQALAMQPSNPDYVYLKHDILVQVYEQTNDESLAQQAHELINKFKRSEPYHPHVYNSQLKYFLEKSNFLEALSVNAVGVNNFPWDIDKYEHRVSILHNLGNESMREENKQQADLYWQEALEVYNTVLTKMKELENLPEAQLQGRAFQVTDQMAADIEQIEQKLNSSG